MAGVDHMLVFGWHGWKMGGWACGKRWTKSVNTLEMKHHAYHTDMILPVVSIVGLRLVFILPFPQNHTIYISA